MHKSPISEFKKWFKKAKQKDALLAVQMTLATVKKNGRPAARTLLLKGADAKGFRFFTNYQSQKSQELKKLPYGTLVFNWYNIQVQVRVEGKVARLSRRESVAYFKTRPRLSQIGAWASPQSERILDRNFLLNRVHQFETKFNNIEVPCPPHWGGFILIPNYIDFVFLKENRLHDRFTYRKSRSTWKVEQVGP